MIRAKEIDKISEQLSVLEIITRAFSELASTHMKHTRTEVLTNREFVTDISLVFDEVRASYADELAKKQLGSRGKDGKITFLSHNGKTVSVLLSANSGLYGKIVADTFDLFKKEVAQNNTEITIVGRQGLPLFNSLFPKRAYTFFDIEDRERDQGQLSALARHIVQYDEIHLFYGKFHNIVSQTPDVLSISSKIDLTPKSGNRRKYIFEPDIITILQFFESELFTSLLSQTMQESTLAKLASRVLSMDAATDRISQERKKLAKIQMAMIHREANKKQLNSLSGILSIQPT